MLRFYAARLANDIDSCLACFSPNVVLEVVNATGLFLFDGGQAGKAAMRRSIEANQTEIEILGIDVNDMLIDGERVAVRRSLRMRGRGTGSERTVELFEYGRVVDGLIVELFQHLDTATAAQALGRAYEATV